MLHEKISLREERGDVYMETYIIRDPLCENRKRPLVVVCPGGGYRFCSGREAECVALNFNAAGFHAVVVYYSVGDLFPKALEDLSKAVAVVRENADEWRVDENRIVVCGFSAGGHLAASLGVFWNSLVKREDGKNKPNGMILCYPVITSGEKSHADSIRVLSGGDKAIMEQVSLEKRVNGDCPPAFLWHTYPDELVPVENSVYMLSSLVENKIPTEAHIYPKGHHGLSLATDWVARGEAGKVATVEGWIRQAVRWIEEEIR